MSERTFPEFLQSLVDSGTNYWVDIITREDALSVLEAYKKAERCDLLEDSAIETTNMLTQKLAQYIEKAEKYDELETMFKIYAGELCWQQDRFIEVFTKLEAIKTECKKHLNVFSPHYDPSTAFDQGKDDLAREILKVLEAEEKHE